MTSYQSDRLSVLLEFSLSVMTDEYDAFQGLDKETNTKITIP